MATSKHTTKKAVSLEATLYSQKGAKAGTITLSEKVFGAPWNADLVHQVITSMAANKRAGTAHTKDRSEVSGGGKKPWKQKGTGQARHGSNRSPIWTGGGITFGPRNDKDYSKKINKKSRVKALYIVLSRKYAMGSMLFIDALSLPAIKTKDADLVLKAFAKAEGFAAIDSEKRTNALIVVPTLEDTVTKSFANLPGVTITTALELNPTMLLGYRHIVMVDPAQIVPTLESKMK